MLLSINNKSLLNIRITGSGHYLQDAYLLQGMIEFIMTRSRPFFSLNLYINLYYLFSLDATKSKEYLQQIVSKHFSQWGKLLCVKVLRDWANRPYSFVQYEVMRSMFTTNSHIIIVQTDCISYSALILWLTQ